MINLLLKSIHTNADKDIAITELYNFLKHHIEDTPPNIEIAVRVFVLWLLNPAGNVQNDY